MVANDAVFALDRADDIEIVFDIRSNDFLNEEEIADPLLLVNQACPSHVPGSIQDAASTRLHDKRKGAKIGRSDPCSRVV